MDTSDVNNIQEKFPFLSCIQRCDEQFIGIIQNVDEKFMSFYDFQAITTSEERNLFVEFGEIWWWESNRQLPINIFLQGQMEVFKYCLRTVSVKDTEVLFGPITSLNDLFKKRIKRRQIQLVRKS